MVEPAVGSSDRNVLLAFAPLIVEACRGEERVSGFEADEALVDAVVEAFGVPPENVDLLASLCWDVGSRWGPSTSSNEIVALSAQR